MKLEQILPEIRRGRLFREKNSMSKFRHSQDVAGMTFSVWEILHGDFEIKPVKKQKK
jgi:hypothetical protein